MYTRRNFFGMAGAAGALLLGSSSLGLAQDAVGPAAGGPPSFGPPLPDHVKGGTAITEVFGDGQKMTAVVVGYDADIDNAMLSMSSFAVENRTITSVYASTSAKPADHGENGRFVVIELSPDDDGAATFASTGRSMERTDAAATVTQIGTVTTVDGQSYDPTDLAVPITSTSNLIVDDFDQLVFSEPKTGDVVEYNVYLPENYDPMRAYPLVLFMHDAGVTSTVVDTTLVQGLGAVVWASPEEQAKHEAIVLAPQFSVQVAGGSEDTSWVETVVDLVNHVADRHSIDRSRLYTTGQSGGAMLSLAIMIKYPDFFTAAFIVAGQADPDKVAPLAKTKQWIVVAEGDMNAYPTQNAMTEVYEGLGTRVSRATWSGLSTAEQFADQVAAIEAQGASINYTVLAKGTVVPEGQTDDPGSNHIKTWRIAYTIEGIRDWLFAQVK